MIVKYLFDVRSRSLKWNKNVKRLFKYFTNGFVIANCEINQTVPAISGNNQNEAINNNVMMAMAHLMLHCMFLLFTELYQCNLDVIQGKCY